MRQNRNPPSHPRGLSNLQRRWTGIPERNGRTRPALAGGKVGVPNKGRIPPLPLLHKESTPSNGTEEKENPTRDGRHIAARTTPRKKIDTTGGADRAAPKTKTKAGSAGARTKKGRRRRNQLRGTHHNNDTRKQRG